MIGISKIQIPSAVGFQQQDADDLLPHPAALVFEQAPMARFRRDRHVVGLVFPLTAGFEDVQDAIENFSFVGPGPSSPRPLGQQGRQIVPLDICHIGPIRLPWNRRNME